ncbi:MAG: MFS transporter [Pseudomonadota bacterium]
MNNQHTLIWRRKVIWACGLASGIVFADMIALNTALPFIQDDLKIDSVDTYWLSEIYLLFLASLVLVGGTLSDCWGQYKIFIIGVIGFGLSSLLCALSNSGDTLIFSRALQGISAALLAPSSLAMIRLWSEDDENKAVANWVKISSMIIPLGPIIGGISVQFFSWHWIFAANIPVSLMILWLLKNVPPRMNIKKKQVDWAGGIVITLALICLIVAVLEHARDALNALQFISLIFAGLILLFIFIRIQKKSTSPMLPPILFKSRAFVLVNLQTLLMFGSFQAAIFFVPFLLVQIFEYSGLEAGAAFFPISIAVIALSGSIGKLADRFGTHVFLTLGPLMMGAAIFGLSFADHSWRYWPNFFIYVCLLSLGVAFIVVPLTTAAMNAIERERSGLAAGVNNACARLSVLLCIAAMGWILLQGFRKRLKDISQDYHLTTNIFEQAAHSLAEIEKTIQSLDIADETKLQLYHHIEYAYFASYSEMMYLAAFICAVSSVLGWYSTNRKHKTT